MDYLEIMSFCGYDLDRANEMAKKHETKSLAEIIEEMMDETGLESRKGLDDVTHLQPESRTK